VLINQGIEHDWG